MDTISKKACLVVAFVVLSVVGGQSQSGSPIAKQRSLGVVKDGSKFDSCGCSLSFNKVDQTKERAVFLSDLDGNANGQRAATNVIGTCGC